MRVKKRPEVQGRFASLKWVLSLIPYLWHWCQDNPRIKLFIVKYILIFLKIGVRMVGVSILLNSFNPLRRCIELWRGFYLSIPKTKDLRMCHFYIVQKGKTNWLESVDSWCSLCAVCVRKHESLTTHSTRRPPMFMQDGITLKLNRRTANDGG